MQQVTRDYSPARLAGGFATALALALFVASPASAWFFFHKDNNEPDAPDAEACVTVVEADFGAYTAEKCVKVYADDNNSNPAPKNNNFTYVYTIENDAASFTNIIRFALEVPTNAGAVKGTGIVDNSGGVEPSDITESPGEVDFFFQNVGPVGGPCEGIAGICPGAISAPLVVQSPFGPGDVSDNMFTLVDDFLLDESSTCIGPDTLPNPNPCSPKFWKLRAEGEFFTSFHFPGAQFDQLLQFAADTSSVYDTPWDVKLGLFTGFFTTFTEAAERELSALLLNIAAGELFPAQTKCRLFFDTPVDTDGDGVGDTTVGELLVVVESNILSGDLGLIIDAKRIAEDLNDGVGLLDTTTF